jgi:hypothetical protein
MGEEYNLTRNDDDLSFETIRLTVSMMKEYEKISTPGMSDLGSNSGVLPAEKELITANNIISTTGKPAQKI